MCSLSTSSGAVASLVICGVFACGCECLRVRRYERACTILFCLEFPSEHLAALGLWVSPLGRGIGRRVATITRLARDILYAGLCVRVCMYTGVCVYGYVRACMRACGVCVCACAGVCA